MAIYIQIQKAEEDAGMVIYQFGDSERIVGSVTLDKSSGAVELLSIEEGCRRDFFVPRVARALARHHESGEYPDETCYAA